MQRAFFAGSMTRFRRSLADHLQSVLNESGLDRVTVPTAICMVLGAEHGGNDVAVELVRRFWLLDNDSGHAIDFYYLGWRLRLVDDSPEPTFDLADYSLAKRALRDAGVGRLSGNADLILADATVARNEAAVLHLESAIQIDLTRLIASSADLTLGAFLEALLDATHGLSGSASVWRISDELGLIYGRDSIVEAFWAKLGAFVGASRLTQLAVRGVGQPLPLVHGAPADST